LLKIEAPSWCLVI